MKKAQAAAEFLTTYGFAMFVVLIAISALSLFVITGDKKTPEFCTFNMVLPCVGYPSLTNSELNIALKNNAITKITITEVSLTGCDGTHSASVGKYNQTYSNFPITVGKNQIIKIKSACSFTDKFKGTMILKYIEFETGLEKSISGEISANVA